MITSTKGSVCAISKNSGQQFGGDDSLKSCYQESNLEIFKVPPTDVWFLRRIRNIKMYGAPSILRSHSPAT